MTPLILAVVFQQGRPIHPKTLASTLVSDKPVTAREARETFGRMVALLTKVHGQPLGTGSIPLADRPVTRTETVAEMARIYRASEPTFRFTPAPTPYDASKFRIDAMQKTSLGRLVKQGCVAPLGPLATGPGLGLTPKEFGDAVGFFMARLSQVSHMPSPKWTPMLQEG